MRAITGYIAMAEIDGSTPLTPIWPQRPTRIIEQGEKASDENRRQRQQDKRKDKQKNEDGKPHVDEYA